MSTVLFMALGLCIFEKTFPDASADDGGDLYVSFIAFFIFSIMISVIGVNAGGGLIGLLAA